MPRSAITTGRAVPATTAAAVAVRLQPSFRRRRCHTDLEVHLLGPSGTAAKPVRPARRRFGAAS